MKIAAVIALALAAYLNALIIAFPDGSAAIAIDFRVFWNAARATDVYAPATYPFVNPPTALLWLEPLSLVGFWPGFALWTIGSLALFFCAAQRAFPQSAALMALASPVLLKAAMLGQVTLFLGAAILWAFTRSGVIGGLIIGVAASIKPQLLLLAPLAFIVRGDWRMLAASLAGGSLSVVAALLVYGPALWLDWLNSLPAFYERLIALNVLQHAVSPAGRAEWLGWPSLPFLLLGLAAGVLAVLSWARKLEGGYLACLVIGCSAIAAPYSLPHDLVIVLPAAAAILMTGTGLATIPALLLFTGSLLPLVLVTCALWAGKDRLPSRRSGRATIAPLRNTS